MPDADSRTNADPTVSYEVDVRVGTLMDEARRDAAEGRPTQGTRGAADTEACERLKGGY